MRVSGIATATEVLITLHRCSIIGCMLAQFYVISRGLVKVRDLYTVDRNGLCVSSILH